MHKIRPFRALSTLSLGVLFTFTACDAPDESDVPMAPTFASVASPSLLVCPTGTERADSGLLSAVGGLLSVAGHLVHVPAAAISQPVEIGIEVPASRYMLIDLTANGQEHWQFQAPITVSIDYSRCHVGLFAPPLTVWHVDPATGEPLEHMGGFDNRLLKRVTFTTDHFSGYAIAN